MADGKAAQREWRVTGMDCGACAAKVRGAVERLPGVAEVDVALMSERLRLTLNEGETSPERIEKAVRGIGFGISAKGAKAEKPKVGFVLPDDAMPDDDGAGPEPRSAPDAPPEPNWYQTSRVWCLAALPCLLRRGPRGWSCRPRFHTGCSFWPH